MRSSRLLVLIPFAVAPLGAQAVYHVDRMVGASGAAVNGMLVSLVDSGFSGAVIVERNDTLLLAAGYGYSNRERKVPFTVNTIAQVGSLTKQFTGSAIANLIANGRLRPSDSLGALLPEVPAQARGITVEMLLTHTAGLPDNCGGDFDTVPASQLVHRCLALPLIDRPGLRFKYSNLGYSVLAQVLERASGRPFEQYLRDTFFQPLSLRTIGMTYPHPEGDEFAVGYHDGARQENIAGAIAKLAGADWNLKGNGGLQASAMDMYGWYRALKTGPVPSKEVREQLFVPRVQREPGVNYGYGWFLRTDGVGRVHQISHSGSDGTFVSLWVWRPDARTFVYTVSNTGENELTESLAGRILAVIR